ncbi:MAG TPA: CopD family protein, partial [Vicinamibacterales bacterium]
MSAFVGLYPFLAVLLRAATLAFEALTVGGVIFQLAIARKDLLSELGTTLSRLVACFALVLAITQAAYMAATSAVLMISADLRWTDVAGANFFVSGCAVIVGAGLVGAFARSGVAGSAGLAGCVLILYGSVTTSHAFGRLDHRWAMAALTALHHAASAAWIGAMPYLLLSLGRIRTESTAATILKRFSTAATISLGVLIGAGLLMSRAYIGTAAALTGTAYGIMLLSKVALTALLVALGGLNLRIVRAIRAGAAPRLLPLRRFLEAELGIGVTILLAAASLTSSPPAIDVEADRVSGREIAARMAPHWPRMRTPSVEALSPATPIDASIPLSASFVPGQQVDKNKPADIAWSEYNHHWAGLIVAAIGILSLCARRWTWARAGPLLFLGLAVFLLIRADPENWPLGPNGFWASFQVAEVAQHRLFVLLIVIFAVFEWSVQTSRVGAERAGLVFPLVCAAGGALLLTHSHSLGNAKEEFLAELSHIPLAVLAVMAGWSRWLEVRLTPIPPPLRWIWPVCFTLIGAILLNSN